MSFDFYIWGHARNEAHYKELLTALRTFDFVVEAAYLATVVSAIPPVIVTPPPEPIPQPTPVLFNVGARVRVKANADIYWDANGANVKNAPQTKYGDWIVLSISGLRRALMKWRPDGGSDPIRNSDEWVNVSDLEAASLQQK